MRTLLPCPFCGKQSDLEHPDTIYPNGSGWLEHPDGSRHYKFYREVPRNQWCYSVHCYESNGGCGAEISGDSITEAINKWNRRT